MLSLTLEVFLCSNRGPKMQLTRVSNFLVGKPYQTLIIIPSRVCLYVLKYVRRGSLRSKEDNLTLQKKVFFFQDPKGSSKHLTFLQCSDFFIA